MKPEFWEHNLNLLKQRDIALSRRILRVPLAGKYRVVPSRKGYPALVHSREPGDQQTLHSTYDPLQEASRFIQSCRIQEKMDFIVFGMGLGYHLLDLVRQVPSSARIHIFEKELEIIRLAFNHIDLAPLLNHPGVRFHVGLSPDEVPLALSESDRLELVLNGHAQVSQPALTNLNSRYYSDIDRIIHQVLQTSKVDLQTRAAFSKTFYKNILSNWQHLKTSPGIHPLEKSLEGVHAIIISAGPSLDKNIGLLKMAENRTLLIAVATALNPLLRSGIIPDVVVAIDADETTIKSFDLEEYPEKLWLLYDPCVPPMVPEKFPDHKLTFDSNVYLSQWLGQYIGSKGMLGDCYSVAHAAFLFAQYLGCDPITLVGQDLSFDGYRLHCSNSFYGQSHLDGVGKANTVNGLEKQKFGKYADSLFPAMDIFHQAITTTTAMKTYKARFAEAVKRTSRVYNATEGGVPIQGTENRTLREVLTRINGFGSVDKISHFSKYLKQPEEGDNFQPAMQRILAQLKNLTHQIAKARTTIPDEEDPGDHQNSHFTADMETLYQILLADSELVLLLQGYDYAAFIEWNQKNSRLEAKKNQETDLDLTEERLQRDLKFLPHLEEAAGFLMRAFNQVLGESQTAQNLSLAKQTLDASSS